MKRGSSIINTSSVTAYKGSAGMLDYSATKGAIATFTRSLALQLLPKGIRVNAVAPYVVSYFLLQLGFNTDKVVVAQWTYLYSTSTCISI